jgi:hypothetical protein
VYIRLEGLEHLLVKTVQGADGLPQELILAKLGSDPELNLFFTAERGRRERPGLWEGVTDFHLLQALENYKRRLGRLKPALIAVTGKYPETTEGQVLEPRE